MLIEVQRLSWGAALALVLVPALGATTIPRLTFEQLTDASETIASGRVTQTWAAWDAEHKYIWTHYLLSVADVAKGAPGNSVEFAEPGGATKDGAMAIAGSVSFAIGENVVVFLSRMPNGYLRTAGWSQGKFGLDANGRLHGAALMGAELSDAAAGAAGTPLTSINGLTLGELKARVAARMRATGGRVQ